jgi:hypothetical protein
MKTRPKTGIKGTIFFSSANFSFLSTNDTKRKFGVANYTNFNHEFARIFIE